MQYMKFDDRDKAALRTLDGSFTFSSDGTTATVTMVDRTPFRGQRRSTSAENKISRRGAVRCADPA